MSRIARKQTISPKVFRQFAAITITLTAIIAVLASGENRTAIAEAATQPAQQARSKPAPRPGQSVAFRASRQGQTWGSDEGGGGDGEEIADYSPTVVTAQPRQPSVAMSPALQLMSAGELPDTPPPGMPLQVFLQIKRERERLKSAGPLVATGEDISRMKEESRYRSGGEDLPAEQTD